MIVQKVAGNHKPVHEYSVMLCYVVFQGEYRGIYLAVRLGGKNSFLAWSTMLGHKDCTLRKK